jgi:hypothetical protein
MLFQQFTRGVSGDISQVTMQYKTERGAAKSVVSFSISLPVSAEAFILLSQFQFSVTQSTHICFCEL